MYVNVLHVQLWHGAFDTSLIKSVRLQNLKDQILTTNVWLEHVSVELY